MLRRNAKIDLENVNHPGQVKRADADMYDAMKRAFLKILPKSAPGLTVAEIQERVLAHLPEELFPGGAKAGWWTKAVQGCSSDLCSGVRRQLGEVLSGVPRSPRSVH
jgi:hypothetical protein